MSVVSQGPGWWQASDGKWYPPRPAPTESAPLVAPSSLSPTWTVLSANGSLVLSQSDQEYSVYDQSNTYGRWPRTEEGYRFANDTYAADAQVSGARGCVHRDGLSGSSRSRPPSRSSYQVQVVRRSAQLRRQQSSSIGLGQEDKPAEPRIRSGGLGIRDYCRCTGLVVYSRLVHGYLRALRCVCNPLSIHTPGQQEESPRSTDHPRHTAGDAPANGGDATAASSATGLSRPRASRKWGSLAWSRLATVTVAPATTSHGLRVPGTRLASALQKVGLEAACTRDRTVERPSP